MWPFRRRRDEPEETASAPGPASPPAGEADVARLERPATGDWMTLPAVRTAASATMPTTFRVQTLPEILTSHHDTRLSGSLGHAVSAEAPSGTIAGLAATAGSHAAAPPDRASTVLREPAHHQEPEPAPAPALQRRLATSVDAGPLPVSRSAGGEDGPMSSIAPPAARLPEPAVSRVLANPAPMSSPASLGDRPLPVARVVDTAARPAATPPAAEATASPAAAASPAAGAPGSPAAASTTSGAPESGGGSLGGGSLGGDDRVGGFEVDLASLLGEGVTSDDDVPLITPPADLAPPIQRAVSRPGETAAPSLGGLAPHAEASAPPPLRAPVQHRADPDAPSSAPGTGDPSITAAPPSSTPPAPDPASPDPALPDPASPDPVSPVSQQSPATGDTGGGAPGGTGAMPPIQRLAGPGDASTPAPAATPSTPSAPAGDDSPTAEDRPTAGLGARDPRTATPFGAPAAAGVVADGPSAGGDLLLAGAALQRRAEGDSETGGAGGDGGIHFAGDGHDHGDDEAPAGPVQRATGEAPAGPGAPLAGASPLASDAGSGAGGDEERAEEATSGLPAGEDFPLVSRHAEPTAPTLGLDAGAGPLPLPLQTLSDTVTTGPGTGTETLPLAPPEQPGTLVPPAGAGPSASGPAASTAPSAGLVGEGRPLSAVSTPGPSPSPSAGAPTASTPSPLAAQRQLAPTAGTAFGTRGGGGAGSATTPPGAGPSSAGVVTLAAPLGGASLAGPSEISGLPMTVLGAPSGEPSVVPLQRRFDADAVGPPAAADDWSSFASGLSESGDPAARASSPGLLMAQRSTSSTSSTYRASPTYPASPTTSTSPGSPSPGDSGPLPLHSAAASVPSTTDLLVKAGLGERGSDGSFLRATPPPGTESSFTVQTAPPSSSSGTSPGSTVQREVAIDEVTTSVSPNTSGAPAGESEGGLPQDPRKLYRKIRAELEADIRRQLEAKNRYNRFRP